MSRASAVIRPEQPTTVLDRRPVQPSRTANPGFAKNAFEKPGHAVARLAAFDADPTTADS